MRLPALAIACLSVVALAAQESPIEVVSIKRSSPDAQGGSFGTRPGGGISTINMPMRSLITLAYEIPNIENIEGAPDWFAREGFDVTAKYTGLPDPQRLREAWRAVFVDRFKLKARLETRDVPAFDVVLARPERGVPSGLTRVDVDCAGRRDAFRRGEKPPELKPLANGLLPCSSSFVQTTIISGGLPIAQFLRSIQNGVGRILVDKTGLAGNYSFTLKHASARPGAAPDPDGAPDLVTALTEQLGLKLEPTRTMTDYLVIEHIERPTPD